MSADAGFLLAVWWIAAGLAIISSLLMGSLICSRVVEQIYVRREELLRQGLLSRVRATVTGRLHTLDFRVLDNVRRAALPHIVESLLNSARADKRTALMKALELVDVVASLAASLKEGDADERYDALQVLQELDSPGVTDAAWAALSGGDPNIQHLALAALRVRGAVGSIPALLRRLDIADDVPKPGILVEIAGIRGQAAFWQRILRDTDSAVGWKVCAIYSLARESRAIAIPPLISATSDAAPDVRAQAFRALAILEAREAGPLAVAGLRDAAWPVRTQAAFCAGKTAVQDAIPLLVEMLDERSWWPRYRAAEALYRLGSVGRTILEVKSSEPNRSGRVASVVLAEKRVSG